MSLPTDKKERKQRPIGTGVLDYFPDALAEVAYTSFVGNEQHNAGEPLHWAREKSTDEADALIRHFLERGTIDTDGVRHSAKMAWRALALLQKEIEAERAGKAVEPGMIVPMATIRSGTSVDICGAVDLLTRKGCLRAPGHEGIHAAVGRMWENNTPYSFNASKRGMKL